MSDEDSGDYADYENKVDYGIRFPLPAHEDQSLGRDEFLKQLFETYEKEEEARQEAQSSHTAYSRHRRIENVDPITAEEMAIFEMMRNIGKTVEFHEIGDFKVTLTAAEKKIIYEKFLVQFKKDALEYLSVRLTKILEVFVNIWPGGDIKIPYNLFQWSVEHFYARTRINQLYLDILKIEKTTTELNCAKFCTDVQEVIRLLAAIRNDVRTNADFCKSSMVLINKSNYDTTSKWVLNLDQDRDTRASLVMTVFSQQDYKEKLFRESLITANKAYDAYMPIELRYRINWTRSNGEQYLMWLQDKEKVLQDELDELNSLTNGDSLAHEFRDFVGQFEIDKYRVSIAHWEEKLEVDMEDMELKNNILRNRCSKALDDLKFYMDQVEMFKDKIAEVLMLEEDEERAKHSSMARRGTRASFAPIRNSTRKSLPKKKKRKGKKK